MSKQLLRPATAADRLAVKPTKFWEDFVERPGHEFIPQTTVRRLRMIRLGPRSVAATEDEVDRVIDELAAAGGQIKAVPRPQPRSSKTGRAGATDDAT
jgi:hypothetical protein